MARIHRLDRLLPEHVRESIPRETKEAIDQINEALAALEVDGDRPASGATRVFRLVETSRTLKRDLGAESVNGFVRRLVALLVEGELANASTTPGRHMSVFDHMQLCKALHVLVRGKNRFLITERVPWRPFVDLLEHRHLGGRIEDLGQHGGLLDRHLKVLVSLLRDLRRLFDPEAAVELWGWVRERLANPRSQSIFFGAGLVYLCSPTEHGAYGELLPQFLDTWVQVDYCMEWDTMWLTMLCRARKHAPTDLHWKERALPLVLRCVRRSLGLAVLGGPTSPVNRKMPTICNRCFLHGVNFSTKRFEKLAKLLVFFLAQPAHIENPEGSPTVAPVLEQVAQVLRFGRTLLHPSSRNPSSAPFAVLLASLCAEISRTVGWQQGLAAAGVSPPFRWVPSLQRGTIDALRNLIMPELERGLLHRDPGVAGQCQGALRHLCFVSPCAVGPQLLDFIALALDPAAVHNAHQAPAALGLLRAILPATLYPLPLLLPRLAHLLNLSLSGIDPNDQQKTLNTLALCSKVLGLIPVNSAPDWYRTVAAARARELLPLDHDPDPEFFNDLEDTLTGLGDSLSVWSLDLLDRLIYLLQLQEAPAKSVGSEFDMAMFLTGQQSMLLRFLAWQLFSQLSEDIRRRASERVINFIASEPAHDSSKDSSFLVEACVGVDPAQNFSAFFRTLEEPLSGEASTRDKLWALRMLAAACRFAGRELCPHESRLRAVLSSHLEHEDKQIRKVAGKVFRAVLFSLVELYPTEFRSVQPQDPPRPLGEPLSWDALTVSWHICQAEELAMAARLVRQVLDDSRAFFEKAIARSGGDQDASIVHSFDSVEWAAKLKVLVQVLRGGISLFHDRSLAAGSHLADCSVLNTGSAVILHPSLAERTALDGMRREVLDLAHTIFPVILSEDGLRPQRPKLVKLWLKLVGQLCGDRASLAHQGRSRRALATNAKRMARNASQRTEARAVFECAVRSGASFEEADQALSAVSNGASRFVMVQRVYAHLLQRQAQAGFDTARRLKGASGAVLAGGYELVVRDCFSACQMDYSTIRSTAQSYLVYRVWPVLGWVVRQSLPEVIASLFDPQTSYASATGAMFLLSSRKAMNKVCTTPSLLSALVDGLVGYVGKPDERFPTEDGNKFSQRLFSMLSAMVSCWSLPAIETGRQVCERQRLQEQVLGLLEGKVEGASSGLSWRYHLFFSWLLMRLYQPWEVPSPQTVDLFFRGLTAGRGQPQQKLSVAFVHRLLLACLNAAGNTKGNGAGSDGTIGGGAGNSHPSEASQAWAHAVEVMGSAAGCRALVEGLAFDRKSQDAAARGAMFRQREQWSTGVQEVIGDAGRTLPRMFPSTRLTYLSYVYKSKHSYDISRLVRLCGAPVVARLVEAVRDFQSSADRDPADDRFYSCVAAEVVGGMAHALASDGLAEHLEEGVSDVWDQVTDFLDAQVSPLSLDFSSDFADALRFALGNRRTDRFQSLSRLLLRRVREALGHQDQEDLDGLDGSAAARVAGEGGTTVEGRVSGIRDDYSTQAKWVQLQQAFLIECPKAGSCPAQDLAVDLSLRLAPIVSANLSHPYKICRQVLSSSLFLLYDYGPLAEDPAFLAQRQAAVDLALENTVLAEDHTMDAPHPLHEPAAVGQPSTTETTSASELPCAPGGGQRKLSPEQEAFLRSNAEKLQSLFAGLTAKRGALGPRDLAASYESLPQEKRAQLSAVLGMDQELLQAFVESLRSLGSDEFQALLEPGPTSLGQRSAGEAGNGTSSAMVGGTAGTTTTSSSAKRARETVLFWQMAIQDMGEQSLHGSWTLPKLLPVAFQGLQDPDKEAAVVAQQALFSMSQTLDVSKEQFEEVFHQLVNHGKSSSWKIRHELARFVGRLRARHIATWDHTMEKRMDSLAESLLGDERKEVQTAAQETQSLILTVYDDAALRATTNHFVDLASSMARKKHRRKAGGDAPTKKELQRAAKTTTGVQGLIAVLHAFPYDVRPETVTAIGTLARMVGATPEITSVVRAAFAEFKRTHQDEWHRHVEKFDPETLDAFNESFESPSYFC